MLDAIDKTHVKNQSLEIGRRTAHIGATSSHQPMTTTNPQALQQKYERCLILHEPISASTIARRSKAAPY